MKLQTRFRAVWMISSGGGLALTLVLAWSLQETRKANAAEDLAVALQRQVLERVLLRDEFLLYWEPRAKALLDRKTVHLVGLLEEAAARFERADERRIVAEMARGVERSRTLLDEIVRVRSNGTTKADARGTNDQLRQRLTSGLLVTSFDLYSRASALAAGASRRAARSQRVTLLLTFVMIGSVLALSIGNGLLTYRLLDRRITRLREGTSHLAAGDLAHRIALDDDDELAELGRAFDTMAAELQRAQASLESQAVKVAALNEELNRQVMQLEAANKELEAFSYSVSHDLRAPLRHVQGYVDMLAREAAGHVTDKGQRYMKTIADASREMGVLIDDLLAFSRMGRTEMCEASVDLDALVQDTLRDLETSTRERTIVWTIPPLPSVQADAAMLNLALVNLLGNAVKFTRPRDPARIEIGTAGTEDGRIILFVRDNGVGFDPQYTHKLFGVFQRLHRADEFEGTGIGLANVRRIIARHGGRTWAEGSLDRGAAFYFTLEPSKKRTEDQR